MYPTLLSIHSLWRWAVLATALLAVAAAVRGLAGNRPFAPTGRKAGILYVTALDMQFLLGLGLLFLSPIVRSAWMDFGGAMKVKDLRFFLVEHTTAMFVAVALAHVGWARCQRAAEDILKFRRLLFWNILSLAAVLVGVPWWRPFLRGT